MMNNLQALIGMKANHERRHISLREVSRDTGIAYNTLLAMSKQKLEHYPSQAVTGLCDYFGCQLSDLLEIVDEE